MGDTRQTRGVMHFGGLPTEPDVHRLIERFAVPTEGTVIDYADIAAIIRTPVAAPRFRTVTNAWRHRLSKEHNVYLRARDQQFTALKPGERIDLSSAKLRTGMRSVRRAHTVASSTDQARLTVEERKQSDHVQRVTATMIQSARLQAREKRPELTSGVKQAS